MGAPAEVFEEIFTVIEGGKTIGEAAEIIQFPSDSGTRTFTALNQTYKGTNGTGLNYWVAAVSQGTSAISAGALMVTVALPEFMALAVPCLGIAVGTAWYNLDPEGWTNLALLLSDAGWTIKNKVVGFMVESGVIAFPPETIETLKDELARLGAFDTGEEWDGDKPESFNIAQPIVSCENRVGVNVNGTIYVCYYGGIYQDQRSEPYKINGVGFYPNVANGDYKVTSALVDNVLKCIICSKNTFRMSFYSYHVGTLDFNGTGITGEPLQYTYDNKTVYYFDGAFFSNATNEPGLISIGTAAENFATDSKIAQTAWMLQYGTFEENPAEENQQQGAILPAEGVPFRTTYPDWLPWEFPELTGWQIPEVMPIQYPDLLPVESEPYQEPAQNPDADPDAEAQKGLDNLEDPAKNPANDSDPYPEPAPDPDPQPVPDPIPGTSDPVVNPDPIDPNPTPTPSPAVPVPSLPATVGSNKLFTVYNPDASELDQLGGYLWDASIIASIRDIWQEPLDGIISLIQVYATPTVNGSHNIILGFLDSGISADVVSSQFVTVPCGSVTVPENKENATDYAPYTSLHLFLPFIGIVELDTNECMNSTISVDYKVDVYTGTCLATVSVTRSEDMPNGPILYQFSGNCSQQIPLTSGNATGILSALIGGITAGLSVATGGSLGVVAGAHFAGQTLTHEMFHVSHSGNISANAGIMGNKKPYLIIGRRHCYDANGYNRFYGYPANMSVVLGNHSGFVKVKTCLLQTIATTQEHDMILDYLQNGVIL